MINIFINKLNEISNEIINYYAYSNVIVNLQNITNIKIILFNFLLIYYKLKTVKS